MKNKIISILLLLCILFSLVSCVEVTSNIGSNGDDIGTTDTDSSGGGTNDDKDKGAPFTVSLVLNGEKFIPSEEITVQWNDGYVLPTRAVIDKNGIASAFGLDGDYTVTLQNLPEGYTYNPNIYKATNDKKHIDIELFELNSGKGRGSSEYNAIVLKDVGMYRAEIKSGSSVLFFEYAPKKSGTYTIESWVDISSNKINPKVDVYTSNPQYKKLEYTIDGGGAEGKFTKNFVYEVEIASEQISSSNTGQVVFTFAIHVDARSESYFPATVDFAVKYEGAFSLEKIPSNIMVPTQNTERSPEKPAGAVWVDAVVPGTTIFDESYFALWSKEDGGDGYYHLVERDSDGNITSYGPTLYANINCPTKFIDAPFTHVEDPGNKNLTVSNGTENYKLFIEGFYGLVDKNPTDGYYFCVTNCPCRNSEQSPCPGACVEGCENCSKDCRPCPEEAFYNVGYVGVANSEGRCAVTQELKEFLLKYSQNQELFKDGNGWAETNVTPRHDSDEASQWLFACGYYVIP